MHNTGNPLGSTQVLDLYDNSETIDNFVNSQQDETPDRFGVKRLTLAGMIKRSMALRNEINDFSGALTFKPEWSDVPMNVSEGIGGEGGALNLQAEALGNRSEINKITSREALCRTYLEVGLNLIPGSFEQGAVITSATDVVLHEKTGKCYSWSGSFPKVVNRGTLPNSEVEFVDKSSSSLITRHPIFASDFLDKNKKSDQAKELQSAMELSVLWGVDFILDCDVYVQEREQLLDGETVKRPIAIYIPSGLVFRRINSAKIIQLPTGNDVFYTLNFYNRKNITMFNPVVVGDRDTHLGTTGEWGHTFNITGAAENIKLFYPVASKAWGDGFYLGSEWVSGKPNGPVDFLLQEPLTTDCSRNGISFCAGNGNIIKPKNYRVDRIAPMAGIDVEPECSDPNGVGLSLSGIIESPFSENCGGSGLNIFLNKGKVELDITGVGSDKGSKKGLGFKTVLPASTLKGIVTIQDFRSILAKGAGCYLENIKGFCNLLIGSLYIEDSNVELTTGTDTHPLRFQTSFGNNTALANIEIKDYSCRDTRLTPKMTNPYIIERLSSVITTAENIKINTSSITGVLSPRPSVSMGINHQSNSFVQTSYVFGDWGGNNFNVTELHLGASELSSYSYIASSQKMTSTGCSIIKSWRDGELKIGKTSEGGAIWFNGSSHFSGVKATKIGSMCKLITAPGTFDIFLIPVSGDWTGY